jgi:hypothetical protein
MTNLETALKSDDEDDFNWRELLLCSSNSCNVAVGSQCNQT